MNTLKKYLFVLTIPLLLLGTNLQAAELKAYVDHNIVQMGQYIEFSLTLSGKSSSSDPDFSILKQDFDVLSGVSRSSQTQIINGSMSSSNTWTVTIAPKKEGALVIPPISLAGLKSDPITVVVGKAPTKEFSDVFFETNVSSRVVYVQAQLRLDLKLYIKIANIGKSQLDELKIVNAKLFQIGENRQSEVVKNGIRYYLVEQSYFIYPEQSGEMKIPSVRFQAVVTEGSRYSRFGTRRNISAASDAITVKVLGIPSAYPKNAQWLPAEQISLSESFNPDQNAGIGEPITRTITTKAKGLPGAALPPAELTDIKGLKVYPDQGKTDDKLSSNTLMSTRTDTFALIANEAKKIQLNDYKIPWWDTKNNQVRYAELKGKVLNITSNASGSTTNNTTPSQTDTDNALDLALGEQTKPLIDINSSSQSYSVNQKLVLSLIIVFIIIWLLTVIAFALYIRALKRKGTSNSETSSDNELTHENLQKALKSVKQACKDNNAQATRSALISWGNIQFASQLENNTIKGLDQLASFINHSELKASFKAIDSSLYQGTTKDLDLSKFWDIFSTVKNDINLKNNKQKKGKALSDLYKI
jgi:hypothetical protein